MLSEQEQQLQILDVDIQIAEKRLRVASIKKQILETELDILRLHRELEQQTSKDAVAVYA
jgi:hypothetical protein